MNTGAMTMWIPGGDEQPWDVYPVRRTMLLLGLALVTTRMVDPRLSWGVPTLLALAGVAMGTARVERATAEGREATFFYDAWHPMLRSADSTVSQVIAIGVFLTGVGLAVRSGERLIEPEDRAG